MNGSLLDFLFEFKVREAVKNVLADFVTPLTDNHFAKKPLAERGGAPPLTENWQKFFSKNGSKRAKIGVFWPE